MTVIRVNNGGKHRAINIGVACAKYEPFFIVDSDDYLTEGAVQFIEDHFQEIEHDVRFAGISGLKCSIKTKEIMGGNVCFEGFVDATNLEREEFGLNGDKAEVYKTSVLKKYPFPEFEGEKFIGEGIVWNKIALDGYKLRWFNQVIYMCDYLSDGLSMQGVKKDLNNPKGYAVYNIERTKYDAKNEIESKILIQRCIETLYLSVDYKAVYEEIFSSIDFSNELYISTKNKYETLLKYIKEKGYREIAIYGYGLFGRRLKIFLEQNGITVPYVIDQNKKILADVPLFNINQNIPRSESICIALCNGKLEKEDLSKLHCSSDDVWELNSVVKFV